MDKLKSIRKTKLVWASLLVAVLLMCGWIANSLAQEESQETKVDFNALIQETQKLSDKVDDMTMVWWIPEEYWRVSFAEDPTMTAAQTEEFLKVLRPYTLIVVVDGKMGAFGGITYKSEADLRASIQIIDNQGIRHSPLSEDKVDADTKNFLLMMKPFFANMLGPMGQNMHFFVFPAENERGQKIADAKKEGSFSAKLGKREFRWRLPLGSLLPPKMCPKCAEKCSGAWNFCPWCGTKLPNPKG